MAVDHHYLAVVTPVDSRAQEGEHHLEEWVCLDPGGPHGLEESVAGLERTDMVVDHAHFHSGAGALLKGACKRGADFVIGNDVVFEIDVGACRADVGQERLEFVGAVVEHPGVAPLVKLGSAERIGQVSQLRSGAR